MTFYRNGDIDFKGLTISITQREFLNFEALLIHLNDKIETTSGVRYVFALPGGKEITDVKDFVPGRCYVVSSTKKPNLEIKYGSTRETFWNNRKPSGGRFRKDEVGLLVKANDALPSKHHKPRIITVFKNDDRQRGEKVYLNPKTKDTFEDLLNQIGNMLHEDVQTLYTKKDHTKVRFLNAMTIVIHLV